MELFWFIFVLILGLMFLFSGGPSIYRIQHDEWDEYEEGNPYPVRGVGYRGYWTNTNTVGHWPLKQRKDGTWYNYETGEEMVSMTLGEFLKKENIDE